MTLDTFSISDLIATAALHGVEVWISKAGSIRLRPQTDSERKTSTERVKRHREMKRGNTETPSTDETMKRHETPETLIGVSPSPPLPPSLPLSPQTPLSPAHPPAPPHPGINAGTREGKPQESPKPQAKTWAPDAGQRTVNRWFHRRDTTPWSEREQKAWKALHADAIADGLAALDAAYTAEDGEPARYRRKDLATLLNNWQGEIDRWRHFKAPAQSDVRPLQDGYEDPPFLSDDSAIFHKGDRP